MIRRQLDLFQAEQHDLLLRIAAAWQAYRRAGADEAEQRFGEYMDLVEEAEEELLALRERWAETMAAKERLRYVHEFTRAAEGRLPSLAARRVYERTIDPDMEL